MILTWAAPPKAGALDAGSKKRSTLLHGVQERLLPEHHRRVRLERESRRATEARIRVEEVRPIENGSTRLPACLGVPVHKVDGVLRDAQGLKKDEKILGSSDEALQLPRLRSTGCIQTAPLHHACPAETLA